MERNKLKQLAETRWFLPLVCAVSFVFGWWYLSITTCAPLGGDDEIMCISASRISAGRILQGFIAPFRIDRQLQPQLRDGHDAEFRRGLPRGIDIHLVEPDLACVIIGERINLRSEGSARPAPDGPKIDDGHAAFFYDLSREVLISKLLYHIALYKKVSTQGSVAVTKRSRPVKSLMTETLAKPTRRSSSLVSLPRASLISKKRQPDAASRPLTQRVAMRR